MEITDTSYEVHLRPCWDGSRQTFTKSFLKFVLFQHFCHFNTINLCDA